MRFEVHSHTDYSNVRLLDCINKPKKLIDRALELGLSGIAITDHECLSSHMEVNLYAKKLQDKHPGFKVALGNEIYLCDTRESGQKYYHFILIAKNAKGHKALRELSSQAWLNSYFDRGMERVVTTKEELQAVMQKYPNCLIATTACLGGELSSEVLRLHGAEKTGDILTTQAAHQNICDFLLWAQGLFKEDFYIECAPGRSSEQVIVNDRLIRIAECFNIKMVLGCDAHYLKKEDRFVHKAYLNSKGGEREVDSFYEYSYLQSAEEIKENLQDSNLRDYYDILIENSEEIYDKIEFYSLEKKQTIPKIEVKDYPKSIAGWLSDRAESYPVFCSLMLSDNIQERYWANECYVSLLEKMYNKQIPDSEMEEYVARLEIEADIVKTIGEKLDDCLFAYFNTFKHYIDMFWECGSIVGPGRGSATGFLSNYLLGITQLDPIQWNLPYWRFLNKERAELPDIDIDLAPSKRPAILKRIKRERELNFTGDLDEQSKKELGLTLIATFGTEGTRSTILTACRGYRSEDFPDGIDVDTAQYMSSLIPSERGFLWPLKDVLYGNENRKPIKSFINEVEQYDGLLDIMLAIEGLINKRSSHASGVIMFDDDPYELGCFMKTPSGEVITQLDLHMAEAAGMTKYDFLVTEISDKIIQCVKLLVSNNRIPADSLRNIYNTYLHPQVIDIKDKRIWDALSEGAVLDCFQFSTDVGLMAAKKLKPQNPNEMTDANALMRLMAVDRESETPIDKYARFKNNFPASWHNEMREYGVTKEEQELIASIYEPAYGCPSIQEDLMVLLMKAANFTLAEANDARKIVGKKQMSRIPELYEHIYDNVPHTGFANYIWDTGIKPQLGYAFSRNHSLPYSFVGIQTLVLATSFNPIYWNTACLIVNSGSLEMEEMETEEDESTKDKTTDYGKIAKAIGDIRSRGIKVSLIDINKSDYSFYPDEENNEILFGLKAVNKVGGPVVNEIIANRPYTGLYDFLNKTNIKKNAIISLIKSGAFDKIETDSRVMILAKYLWSTCEKKSKVNLQNFNGLLQRDLIPEELSFQKRVFVFNKMLRANCKKGLYYLVMDNYLEFYSQFFPMEDIEVIQGYTCIKQKTWDKMYEAVINEARTWLKQNHDEVLAKLNNMIFLEDWYKYGKTGNPSAWEMESLCFYYGEHELANVDIRRYGLSDFNYLSASPEVDYYFKRKGKEIPIFKTYKIAGTVISKNKTKSTATLLTTTGIVNVKFSNEYFAMFDKRISEKQEDGTKKIKEHSWFERGSMIMVTGFRRDDTFVAKSYTHTPTHQLYKITAVQGSEIELTHERYSGIEEEDSE